MDLPKELKDLESTVENIKHGKAYLQYFADKSSGGITRRDYSTFSSASGKEVEIPIKSAKSGLKGDRKYHLRLEIFPRRKAVCVGLELSYLTSIYLCSDGTMHIQRDDGDSNTDYHEIDKKHRGIFGKLAEMDKELSDYCSRDTE